MPTSILRKQPDLHDPRLPFDIHVDRFFVNSEPRGPMQASGNATPLATAGTNHASVVEKPPATGTEADSTDLPSAYLTFRSGAENLGTYLLSTYPVMNLDQSQDVTSAAGRTRSRAVQAAVQAVHRPPAQVLARQVRRHRHGPQLRQPIRLSDLRNHEDREVTIKMNHPLRYRGETFNISGVIL